MKQQIQAISAEFKKNKHSRIELLGGKMLTKNKGSLYPITKHYMAGTALSVCPVDS